MSYNPNLYKFRGNHATFQHNFRAPFVPPPPTPPLYFIPPTIPIDKLDQDFVISFEHKLPVTQPKPVVVKPLSISKVHQQLCKVVTSLNDLKAKEKMLSDSISSLSEEEWSSHMKEIVANKEIINKTLAEVKGPYLDSLRKSLAKRAAKRLRLKRVRSEIKRENEERTKELQERSRKIEENLQKIKDDIMKAKQEQEAKLAADMVLKDVRRKKNDAKKCAVKLDALAKLRRARLNTAKGRGDNVPDSVGFDVTIEKLKSLWTHQLSNYEAEESQLQATLKEQTPHTDVTVKQVAKNLDVWRQVMFGADMPQVDFHGDVQAFIGVRSQWDKYINGEGTAIPIGWVPPTK